jgi:hypothetical protein
MDATLSQHALLGLRSSSILDPQSSILNRLPGPTFHITFIDAMIRESKVVAYRFSLCVSDMTAYNTNRAIDKAQEEISKRLRNRSVLLKSESRSLVDKSRALRGRCRPVNDSGVRHIHKCMGCKYRWKCAQNRCELKFLCLCFECHRRIGSRL